MVEDYSSLIAFFHSDEKYEQKYDIPDEAKKQADATKDALKKDLASKGRKKTSNGRKRTSKGNEGMPKGYKKSENPENISGYSPLSKEPERYIRDMNGMPEPER